MALIDLRYVKIYEKLEEVIDEGFTLRENIEEDCLNVSRVVERLKLSVEDKMEAVIDFQSLAVDMENEKDRFLAQKSERKHFSKFLDELESLIKIGRVWKFEDYRCIDWIKRVVDILVEIKELFEGRSIVMNKSVISKESLN